MARVQYGGGVTAFAGSIAGNTFQRNPSGEISRARSRSTRAITYKQSVQQLRQFAELVAWRELSTGQQTTWNGFASVHPRINIFGQEKILTGFNWFSLINQNLALQGEATIDDPPTYEEPVPVEDASASFPLGDLHVLGNFPSSPANTSLVIFTTPPLQRTSAQFRQFIRFTKIVTSPSADFDEDITSEWQAAHGISWPLSSPFNVAIGTAVYSIHQSSGVNSAAIFAIAQTSG